MPVSESTQKYILNQYAAHWFHMTPAHGLNGWVEWFEMDSTDEWCVNEAFRRIIQERMENERWNSKDILKLTEMQAVYYRVKREIEDRKTQEEIEKSSCDYCENYGFRWVVFHSDGYKHDERLITHIPEDPTQIKMFCDKYTIPCTCSRGKRLYQSRLETLRKDGRLRKEIDPVKLHGILERKSMNHDQAWRLVNAYLDRRNAIYFPKTKEQDEEVKARQRAFDAFINRLRQRTEQAESPYQVERKDVSTEVPF